MRYMVRIPFPAPGTRDDLPVGSVVSKEAQKTIEDTEQRHALDHPDESLRGQPVEGHVNTLHLLDQYCTRISDEAADAIEQQAQAVLAASQPLRAAAASPAPEAEPPREEQPASVARVRAGSQADAAKP